MADNNELANLFAKLFIARPDVKAVQTSNGYMPDGKREDGKYTEYFPWSRKAILDHIDRERTYGHYLLSQDSKVKLFAFDVDLEKNDDKTGYTGKYDADFPNTANEDPFRWEEFDAREAWQDRAHPARAYMKYQFHHIAHRLGKAIEDELDIQWAAAYSGGKGIHVYGFTGLLDAADARDGAVIVMDALGFTPSKGVNFYKHEDYHNLSIEVFPKQTVIKNEDGFGNLMRLPLGRNLKNPKEPTFFLDMTAPMGQLAPLDPVYALTTASQWRRQGE